MPLILSGNVASATADAGYTVANSCRFNDGDSPYMHKMKAENDEITTMTISVWVKRTTLGATQRIVSHMTASFANYFYFRFNSDDKFAFYSGNTGSADAGYKTNRLFRDVGAWYNIVARIDTTENTAGDRVRIYVNGVEETDFATETNPDEDSTFSMGTTSDPIVVGGLYGDGYGINSGSTQEHFDGYMAEICVCEGQSLAPTSFGEFDEDSPTIWKPKDVSGLTFGTNGFYLDFEDSSNLGNDANGGTDLTEVNLAAADQATDTPTNNFATFNPLDNYYLSGTFSEGNLKVSIDNSSTEAFTTSTIGVSSGKWYMENKIITTSSGRLYSGVVYGTAQATNDWPGGGSDQWFYRSEDGKVYNEGSEAYTGATLADDDIVGIAVDLDNHKLYFSKNGTFQNSGDPTSGATGTGAIALDTGQTYFFAVGESGSTAVVSSANFGSPPFSISSGNADGNGYGDFEYAVPSGFYALCTKNLAEYG